MSKGNGQSDPNITSLDEARRRAADKAKAAKRAAAPPAWTGPPAGPTSPRTARDWLLGGVMIAMALGALATFVARVAPPASVPVPAAGNGDQAQ